MTLLALSKQEIRHTLRDFFVEQLPAWTDDAADSDPLERYGLDSTGIAVLILFLEETFELQIPDEDLTAKNLGSIQAIMNFLERKMAS